MSKGFGVRLAAAMFLVGPAAIHFAVAPEHLRSFPLYGLFFVVLGAVQAALAVIIVVRPSSGALLGAAGLTLLVIAIWLVSRTFGLPIAPMPWQPEPIGLPDLLATFMEWSSVWLLIGADARLDSPRVFRVWRAAPGLGLALLVTVAWTVAGLAAVGEMH